MIACVRCGEAFAEDDLDVLCPHCRDQLWTELAAVLVTSRAREMASAHWARVVWWGRPRPVTPLREAS